MPGANDLSKREVLERLMADLRSLGPDARGREFKKWRASANATMSELFGQRHRLTLAFRDVAFTPDFGQGRARALALLRVASSFSTAPSESKAARSQPATVAVPEWANPTSGMPGTPEPVAIVEPPAIAEPATPDWPDATTELPEIDATAGTSGTANDDASGQPSAPTDDGVSTQPMPDAAAEPTSDAIEPKHERILRRIARRRDFHGTHPAIPDEPTDTMGGVVLNGSPEEVLEGLCVEAPDAVLGETVTAQAALASATEPTEATAQPMPDADAGPTPGAAILPPGTAEPATTDWSDATAGTKSEAIARESDTSWTPRSTVRKQDAPRTAQTTAREFEASETARAFAQESDTSWTPRSTVRELDTSWTPRSTVQEFDAPWTAQTMAPEADKSWTAPALIPYGPTRARQGASRQPKRGHKRQSIAVVGVSLGLAVGVAVWLWLFGGWSTMSGLGSSTVLDTATSLSNPGTISPSANARVVDVTGDPRSSYIVRVVRAGIVQLEPNEAGEVFFLPSELVRRGEFLVWLDRVQRIPAGSREVPDTFYYDLDPPLRYIAIDAYQRRILLEWPDEDTKIAFNAAGPIRAGDAEAWAARMVIGLVSATALENALGITEAEALDLRVRISSLTQQELATIVDGFKLRLKGGWEKEESISRSEAAEFLIRLKVVFEQYLAP